MSCDLEMLEIVYDKEKWARMYDVRVGLVCIANVWSPDKGKGRENFKVRLMFNQPVGKFDYSKDKEFDTLELCDEYIQREFGKCIRRLNVQININKKLLKIRKP